MAAPPPSSSDFEAPTWIWNRSFFAACALRPSSRTPAGDVDAHNSPLLLPHDYAPLWAPSPARLVFVGTCALPAFVRDVLPRAASPFVLVTGMSDPGPAAVLGSTAAAHALAAHPLLRAWYAEMRDFACAPEALCAACARVRALPLGLDLHTLAFRAVDRPAWGPPATPREQAAAFAAAAAAAAMADAAGAPRLPTVYVHFGWRPPPRREVLKLLQRRPELFHFEPDKAVERGELWRRMARHRWVLCLQGGGPDCHRTWEAVGLGCGVSVGYGVGVERGKGRGAGGEGGGVGAGTVA